MLLAGLGLTFAPQELWRYAGVGYQAATVLILQATGALYMGFAVLNWMAKDNLIGGIYSRPVALGNFLHFLLVASALVRALAAGARGAGVPYPYAALRPLRFVVRIRRLRQPASYQSASW